MKNWVIEGKLKTYILLKTLQERKISTLPIQIFRGIREFIPCLVLEQEESRMFVNNINVIYFNFHLNHGMRIDQDGTDIFIIQSMGTWPLGNSTKILAIFSTRKLIYLADPRDSSRLIRQYTNTAAGYSVYKMCDKKIFTVLNTITGEWTIEACSVNLTRGGIGVLVKTDDKYKGWNDILDPLTGKSILANLKGKRSIQYIDNHYYAIFLKGAGTYSLFNSKTGHEIKLGLKIDWNNPERFKIEQDFFFLKTKDDESWRIFSPGTEQFIESI